MSERSKRPMLSATPLRLGAFVVGLAAVFGLAFGVGRVADPDTAPAADHETGGHETGGHADPASTSSTSVHLALTTRSFAPGPDVPVSFQLQDDTGDPVTSYDVKHEKELHLIVLGTRSLTDFQHVHPARASDGTWSVRLSLAPGTSYRLYADGSTLGADFVATADVFTTGGHPSPDPAPAPATRDHVDGLTVDLQQGDGTATLVVTRDGKPVELEPYLGALGHLVVIRVDDLEYLHVHPEGGSTPVFSVAGLAPGRYRYFFDFQVDGVVHTAAFTHDASATQPSGTASMDMEEDSHDSH
jgi:hypothetical protein